MIGIGGIGISALARLLLHSGHEISGTEDNESGETLDALRDAGVRISLDLEPQKLPVADCYIYSDAWLNKHAEVMSEARRRGVMCLSYFEAVGLLSQKYKVVAVAGAHGKTTTTAMMIDVFESACLNPTAIVGSLRAKTKSNFRAGSDMPDSYFIVEACEYRRHFLQFTPHILVITNIDADHLDYFRDLADVQSAFRELALKVPADGFIVCDVSDARVAPVVAGLSCKIIDYRKFFDPALPLRVLPLHRINAAAVLATANVAGINVAVARCALTCFSGTWRRFEYKGKTKSGAEVYDDYGHHPTEVRVTLESVRTQFPDRRIVVAFQPHLYSRTKILLEDFAVAFGSADEVIIAPIYAAREELDPSVSAEILAEKISACGIKARAGASLEEIEKYLADTARAGDLILTMGAGDIYKVGEWLVGEEKTVQSNQNHHSPR